MTLGQRIDRDNAILIKEITADITEKVTADVTERVTADVTGKVTADVTEKLTQKSMYEFLEFLFEDNKTKAEAFTIIAKKYPQYEDKYTTFINEHWKNA